MKKLRAIFFFAIYMLAVVFTGAAFACTTNQIDVLGDGTQCEIAKFSVTTTELTANT